MNLKVTDDPGLNKQHARAIAHAKAIFDNKKKSINKMAIWINKHYLHHDCDVPIYKFRQKQWYCEGFDFYRTYIRLHNRWSKEKVKIQF